MTHPSVASAARLEALDEAQAVVDLNLRILAAKHVALSPESRILDFGCGSGRHVYEHLERGYRNVMGYDLASSAELRRPEDRARFCFSADGRMPFADASFDFVYSYSVLEHAQGFDAVLREIHRVLKPGGVALHVFPAKWRPIEPHTKVPFAGAVRAYGYFLLWALLGIRNQFQRGLPAAETARRNARYAETGINYLSGAELKRRFGAIYAEMSYEERLFVRTARGRSRWLAGPMTWLPGLARLYRVLHTRVVFVRKGDERGAGSMPLKRMADATDV